MKTRTAVQRFCAKVRLPSSRGGCWIWTACGDGNGYGNLYFGGRMAKAHRVAYELFVGPVPAGLELDHLCRNRGCVNPSHLEPVTHRENGLRGVGVGAIAAAKTHCINGHALSGDNLKVTREGYRKCVTCIRTASKRNNLRRKMDPTRSERHRQRERDRYARKIGRFV